MLRIYGRRCVYQPVDACWAVDAPIWKFGHSNLSQWCGTDGQHSTVAFTEPTGGRSLAAPRDEVLRASGLAAARPDDDRVQSHGARPPRSSHATPGAPRDPEMQLVSAGGEATRAGGKQDPSRGAAERQPTANGAPPHA